jgi:hypothetical protein
MAISCFLLAAAGYLIGGRGIASRTTLGVSFWLAVALALLLVAARGHGAAKVLSRACLAMMAICLACASARQSLAWSRSWDREKTVVAALPAETLAGLNSGGFLLLDLAKGGDMEPFGAYWDLSGAIRVLVPGTASRPRGEAVASVLNPSGWRTTWDGQRVVQALCGDGRTLWSFPARKVMLWDEGTGKGRMLAPGEMLGCAL